MATRATWLRRGEVTALVAVGGFAGANLRHVLARSLPALGGTLVANVLGCLALGFLAYEAREVGFLGERTSLVAGTGFLSSFTTYSTFALETVQSAPLVGVANVVANYTLGFAAVLVGRALARRLRPGSDAGASADPEGST
ncbi:fluoride efflux transporter FluC [Halospeciosus flavus]|uniref:Fluoride-specific ion channel FluC n=1 Tax=Halospeciosus flavus TaxID=3032283 RepID=A0ABD5Z5P5_9EURY